MQATPTYKTPASPERLIRAAKKYGTPLYVYEERIIRRQCRLLKQHLKGIRTRLLYAMKANAHPAILDVIRSEGIGIDAVSPAELYLALRAGFEPTDVLYTANNMTDEEMHAVVEQGVLLNLGELSRLERFGRAYPGSDVCIRLNPQIGSGHHVHVVTAGKKTKFGVPVEEIDTVKAIADRHRLRVVGLHQHIGSGIPSMDVLAAAIAVLLESAARFDDLQFLNCGGGFDVPYRPEDVPIDFENFESTVVAMLRAHNGNGRLGELTYWFEPGRFFVAEAGALLVRVNTVKESNGLHFAGTDSGMGHLIRPALYGAYHEIYNLSNPDALRRPYEIVGNICESGDVFAHHRPVQEIREGDILAIMDAGAYGIAMASVYNLRPLPAEVLIRANGKMECIRPGLTHEALVDSLYASYFASQESS